MRALGHTRGGSRRRWLWNGIGAGVIVVAVVLILLLARGGTSSSTTPPNATPFPTTTPTVQNLLAAAANPSGSAVDGIQCQTNEQVVYHIHAHLAVYVNGQQRVLPEGIGITQPRVEVTTDEGPYVDHGGCFYWMHTHTNDGIIHIESPTQTVYTLGQFFDIWGQPLTSSQVGPATGSVIVYVNGQEHTGDPRAIQMTPHELIQLDVGTDFPPQPFTFPAGY